MNPATLVLLSTLVFAQASILRTGSRSVSRRIINGEEINISEAPYAVAIFENENSFQCGGSLISENFVLTAGHCGILTKVLSKHTHPEYDRYTANFDFGLLEIKLEDKLPSNVTFAKLPTNELVVEDKTEVFAVGWGLTVDGDRESVSENLRRVDISVVDEEKCKRIYDAVVGTLKVTKQMLCAGVDEGGKGVCNGDSGGPLVLSSDKTLIGVVSWGTRECVLEGLPGVYAKVSAARSWITEVAGV